MNEIKFNPILEEYLTSLNLLEEVKSLIITSRNKNQKKWSKEEIISSLNLAFDWELPNRGFEYWEEIFNNFSSFKWKKQLAEIKLTGDYSKFVEIMHPTLVKFLVQHECLKNYINNCVIFIEKYSPDHLEKPLSVEEHLKSVRDILNAFRLSEAPEGKEFWKVVNEKFVVWKEK